jgi:hypothetical protein
MRLLIFQLSRPAQGSSQLPIQWVLWILSTGHSADRPFTFICTHEVHRQVNLYLYNMPVFQCSLHCISAHCYTTHAHRKGHLILHCKWCGALHLPPSLSTNDGTLVQLYVTILHLGVTLLTTKTLVFVIYSSQRLHIYIYVSKIHSICQSYSAYHNNNDGR